MSKSGTSIARFRNDGRWKGRGSDWSTPKELFDQLDAEFHFTLDPCASPWSAKCERYFTEEQDRLNQDWGTETVFMNPPYGTALNQWMKKAYESSLNGATVVCLVPASTDLAWFHEYALKGDIRFLRGRPKFVTPEGTWQQTFSPSIIVVFATLLPSHE